MRWIRLLGSLACCLLATSLSAVAQYTRPPLLPGEITGSVQFKGGVPEPNAVTVYLESEMGEAVDQTRLKGNSRFEFRGLARTRFTVRATAPGYRDATAQVDLTMMPMASPLLTLYAEARNTPGAPQGLGSTEPTVPVSTLLIPEGARQEFTRGEEALNQNARAEAFTHFQKATELFPQYYQAYLSLGALYMDDQKWDDAEKALKHSLEINDKYAPSYAALGAVYNRQNRPADARPVLERSLELEPNNWQAHFELGQTLLLEKKDAEAEPHLWRAHELQPKFPLVHFLLGKLSLAKHDLAMARTEFQHFLDVAPDHPLAGPVRQKLAQIDQSLPAKP